MINGHSTNLVSKPSEDCHIYTKRSFEESPTNSQNGVSESIEQIKLKIKNIQSIIKEKGMRPLPNPQVNQSFDGSLMRNTTNFPSSSKNGNFPSKSKAGIAESLIEKANESIRNSYKISFKAKDEREDSVKGLPNNKINLFNPTIKSTNTPTAPSFLHKKHPLNSDLKSKSFMTLSTLSPVKNQERDYTPSNTKTDETKKSWLGKKASQIVKDRENMLPSYLKELSKKRLSNNFQFGSLLGKGKFGEVYIARHIQTGFIVAIKKVSKTKLKEYNMVSRFCEEIKLHSKLDHPNIVKFYGFFEEKDSICLVLEYLNGGTLFDYMNKVGTLSMKEALVFLRQVIEALDYVHGKGICHRDIKPQNIVISSSTGLAKLCDFGWSAVTQTPRQTFCGTLDYASPEIIARCPYNQSVDVWCVGVLTYQMFIGRAPFENADRAAVMDAISNVDKTGIPYIDSVHEDVREFIQALLVKDPSKRPKMFQLLQYPLFVNHQNEMNMSRKSLKQ